MSRGIPRDPSLKRKLLHRLKIARGHLNSVIRMVDNGEYCVDVLNQSLAVQRALHKVDSLMLQNHLKTCAKEAIKGGKEEVIEEIMRVFRRAG